MPEIAAHSAQLLQLLPEADQRFAYELIKKLVLAWDPDFTKLTPEEAERLNAAERSGFVAEEEVDWDDLGKYAS